MSAGTEFIARALAAGMPAWSRRAGLSTSAAARVSRPEQLPAADRIDYLHLHEAGALSLDALYVAASELPARPRDYIELFGKLEAGGIALLEFESSRSFRRELEQVAAGTGLTIRYAGSPSGFARELKSLAGPPALAALEKPPPVLARERERRTLSILPVAADPAQITARLPYYRDFLTQRGLASTAEIVLVDDGFAGSLQTFAQEELRDLRPDSALSIIEHYTGFGPGRAVRSALHFARGNYVLYDPCRDELAPGELYHLLDAMWDAERDAATHDQAVAVRPQLVLSDAESGQRRGRPRPGDFLLLNRGAAELLRLRGRREDAGHFEESLGLLRGRRAVRVDGPNVSRGGGQILLTAN